jgi:cytochrome b
MASMAIDSEQTVPLRKWDPVVRITHWSIMVAIILNAAVTEDGSTAHVWVGYALAALLVLRLLWGFVGPKEARFTAFPPSPSRAVAHIRDIIAGKTTPHASHNPLGALMVYAVWATLAVIIGSGIAMAGLPGSQAHHGRTVATAGAPATGALISDEADEEHEGGGTGGEREEGPLAEVHEAAVNLLYALILLHLAGVAFETRRSGRQIVLAMLGRRG